MKLILSKIILIIVALLITVDCFAQTDTSTHRHFVGMQFGGQTMVSYQYEYSLITKKYFLLNTNLGIGLNEHSDDTDPEDNAIFGIHTGLICLLGPRNIALELGLYPTTYFYGPITFVNLNSWAGIRLSPKKAPEFNMAFGYTPRLFYTYSDPKNSFFNASVGAKFEINF